MNQEKAYKLLAVQENISNNEAKALIDAGVVSAKGQKVSIARALFGVNTKFKVQKIAKPKMIFQNDDILVVDKPAFIPSDKIAENFEGCELINRLDKETSGVILLAKNEEFRQKAIKEYRNLRVNKTYVAVLDGIISEEITVDTPILTIKSKGGAFSKISLNGKEAKTIITPLMISGKKTLAKVLIPTGRTHQIRVHSASINHFVIGDEKYAKHKAKRLYLHSYETEILGMKFRAEIPSDFGDLGFEISKNMLF